MDEENIIRDIDPRCFWDVDSSRLDPEKNARLIIERVMTIGTLDDFRRVRTFYGDERIKHVLKNLNYLDPKTLNFVSLIFDIPLESFKCYKRKQSTRQHWNS